MVGWIGFFIGAVTPLAIHLFVKWWRADVESEYDKQFEKVSKRWLAEMRGECEILRDESGTIKLELDSANREIEELKAKNANQAESITAYARQLNANQTTIGGLNGQLQEQRTLSLSRGAAMQSCLRKVEDAIDLLREPGRTAFKDQFAEACGSQKSG